MKRFFFILVPLFVLLVAGCQGDASSSPQSNNSSIHSENMPPIAQKRPHKLEKHGHERNDPYYWLNQREDPEVIAYLEAENAFVKKEMAHTDALQEELFEELKGRIKQDDSSVPFKYRGYWYYSRYETGKEYPIYCRRKGDMEAEEEPMVNVNVLAEGQSYCQVVGPYTVSLDGKLLAYGLDVVGRRIYELRVKDLETGEELADRIPDMTGNAEWAADGKTLFYSKRHPETLRSYQIWKHVLGTDTKDDELVFEEKDETYRCFVTRTKSDEYLLIQSASTLANEVRYLKADNPGGEWKVFLARERGHEYGIDHAGGYFYIRSNRDATNFKLMRCAESNTAEATWETVIAHRENTLLEDMEIFRDYLAIEERRDGLTHIRLKFNDGRDLFVPIKEKVYTISLGLNPDFEGSQLRYSYTSMTTPASVYEYELATGVNHLRKQQEVLGGFDVKNYVADRLWATAPDGVQVPISVVRHVNTPVDGSAPTLLYGYGSYGYSMDPYFSSSRLSLLDRGFIFAIGHIRGGEDMGRSWYENGRQLKKKNTFTDFIACGEHLINVKQANPDKLYAMGGSAGGLLMGAIINMRPDLWHGVAAAVPFVDVITTMLDETIPLTTGEYDEWGNPNEKVNYDYILSYSPYDNIEAKDYPHMLVTTGLHDSQVQYWEPAKWVAKLRDIKTGNNRLYLHTNMDAGHGGASGRFSALKEIALEYAFLLDLAAENVE
ncbi:MAG: S9 family peptidase [Bacteroidia bacterium]